MNCNRSVHAARRVIVALLTIVVIGLAGSAVVIDLARNPVTLSMAQNGNPGTALLVNGLVQHPLNLTLNDLEAMPSTTINAALYCVGSQISPIAEGNWTGVELAYLLRKANVTMTAIKIAFYAVDGYSTDLPLATGMADDVIVAYEKDGVPLAEGLRLVAPGLWGYKWIAGLSNIDLVDYDFQGLWENQGYTDSGLFGFFLKVNTTSPSVPYSINGTGFATGPDGSALLILEYAADYNISFAQDVALSDGVRLHFLQWGDGSPSPTCIVSISSDTVLSVSFATQYLQTVSVEPSGSATADPSGSVWRNAGDVVNVRAFPALGWTFTGWSGDLNGSANPIQVAMDGPKNIIANFQGQPVPEFPGLLLLLTILIGVSAALLLERRIRFQPIV